MYYKHQEYFSPGITKELVNLFYTLDFMEKMCHFLITKTTCYTLSDVVGHNILKVQGWNCPMFAISTAGP